MRKITLLILLFLGVYSINAQVYLNENFDTSIPATWTITDAGAATGDSWVSGLQGGTNSLNGSNVAVVDSDADGNGTLLLETLTSPIFDTTGATNLFLEFDQFYNNGGGDRAIVEVFDGTNWVEILNQSADAGAFNNPNEQAINITAFSNANMQIRFVYNDNNVWAWYWLIDNVVVSNLLCAEPTAVTLSNITSDGVQVNWSPGGTETAWNVVVQPAGTGVPATGPSQTSPYVVSGLNPSSPYEVYIQSVCGGTNGNSTWAGPFNFNTLNVPPPPPVGVTCSSGTSSTVFTETFGTASGAAPAGWTGTGFGGANGNWDIALPGANSGGTGPNISYDGNPGAHLEYEASGNSTTIANAISPAIDLSTAVDAAELAFFMHAFGDDMGTLNVGVGTSPTGPFTTEYSWVGDYQTSATEAWVPIGVDLSAYLGQVIYIQFSYGGAGTGFEGDMSIDQITVETCGTFCIAPSNIVVTNITDTSAQITWVSNGSETAWNVVVQPAGTGIPTGMGTSEVSPYTVTGLNPTTPYEVYVQASCGGGVFSVWAGPVNFTTENAPPPPPVGVTCATGSSTMIFTETFGTVSGAAPAGWTGTGFGGANGNWRITNPNANSTGTGPNVTYNGTPGVHLEYEASGNSTTIANAITPAIDLSTAVDGAELAFFMHAFGDDIGTLNVGVGTTPTGPFTNVYSYIGALQTTANEVWVPIGVDLSAYLTQTIYIQFSYGGAGTGFEGDLSLDQITVETCGDFCIAPTNLTVTNVGGQSADISWVGVNGETSWNYVVQPAGTGVPANGAGTNVMVPNANVTGLNFSTAYEVYVQANCTNGMTSLWAGPVNFTTTVQTNFSVDCSAAALDFNYCYPNNDTNIFTFTTTTGFPVTITFNAGTVENNFDEFIVYDTDGSQLTPPNFYGNAGNLSGLTYTSTGDTLSFQITSDGSASCGTGGQTPINATVICQTCIAPDVTFTPVGDCSANPDNPEFFIEVNIIDFGSVSSVQVADDQGSPGELPTGPGIVTMGPYPAGTEVIIEVSTDDINCIEYSDPLTIVCPAPPNDCSIIYAGPDQMFDCTDNTIDLTASFQVTGQDFNVYEVNALGGCPTPILSGGTPTSLTIDDRWSDVVNMGFDFCFYGGTYNQLVVGANGAISFDVGVAGQGSGYSFNQPIPNNTSATLRDVNIFVAYHDINPNTCGDINYTILGSAPNRQFVLNYNSVCQFSCTAQQASMQAILYEGSNNIDINVFEKPGCAWNSGSTVIGVQNMAGDNGIAPPGRNTGNWTVDPTAPESYRFSPGQSAVPDYTFEWYEDGIFIGNTETITVFPTQTTTYEATITYPQCAGPPITLTDSVTVEFNGTPADTNFTVAPTCDGATVNIDGDAGGTFAFNPLPTDGAIIDVATGTVTNATPGATYTIEYSIDPTNFCGSTTAETFTVLPGVVIQTASDIEVCDDDNDGFSTFDLSPAGAEVAGSLSGVTVTYHETQVGADNGTPLIVNETAYDNTTADSQIIYVRVEDNSTNCYSTTTFQIVVNELPELSFDNSSPYEVCPNTTIPITIEATLSNFTENEVNISWDYNGSPISGETNLELNTVLLSGDYTITVTNIVTGCQESETVEVLESNSCIIPQGISPNNDGLNDSFDLTSFDVQSIEIFNRNGTKVYVKNDGYTNEWRGQSKDGDQLPTGTYYYVIRYQNGKQKASWVYINR
jgi:gliding motility-associated-like protein